MAQYLKSGLKAILPTRVSNFIRGALRNPLDNQLPVVTESADQAAKQLLRAWEIAQTSDASAPGVVHAYYSFAHGEYKFPGERPWAPRWETLNLITDYTGKRVLELGCNMSLLSCSLLLEKGAESALAVDIDAEILEAAKLVSSALNVSPEYMQVDFDSLNDWEADLSKFSPDLVFALNVLNWVKDKSRLLNFLGRFNEVIFEGHDSFEVERERFEKVGFNKVELISLTERNRPLMHCVK
jgi:2-polyprenyl-3-methyl-5-hydroxy-6-metoxy-1,4-benzoquinol methylase